MISNLWGLALRMIWIKKGRTLFSLIAVALTVGLLSSMFLLYDKMNKAIDHELYEKYGEADYWIGFHHGTIPQLRALTHDDVQRIRESNIVRELGEALEDSQYYTERTDEFIVEGLKYVGVDNSPLAKSYYRFNRSLAAYEVVITSNIANRLKVNVSETVTFPLKSGRRIEWKVAEIIQSRKGSDGKSSEMAYFHLETLQQEMGLSGYVNPIIIDLNPNVNKKTVPFILNSALPMKPIPNIELLDGTEKERDNVLSFQVMGYVLAVIACMVSVVLFMAISQITFRERFTELAVVRSMGGSTQQLGKIVIYEGVIIGFIGAVVGIGFGVWAGHIGTSVLSQWARMDMMQAPIHWWALLGIAIFAWISVIAVSLIPAWKATGIDPIDCFREPGASNGQEKKGVVLLLLLFSLGAAMLIASMTMRSGSGVRVLCSTVGGLVLTIGVSCAILFIVSPVLRFIAALIARLGSRTSLIALKYSVPERKQSAFIIVIISLSLTVFMPISTLFFQVKSTSIHSIESSFVTDYVIHSAAQYPFPSGLPTQLVDDLEQIPGVEKAIPLERPQSARLVDYDFARSDPEWALKYAGKDRKGSIQREQVQFIVTDIEKLSSIGVFPRISGAMESSAVIPLEYAKQLGVAVGDRLQLQIGDLQRTVTIGATLEDFPLYSYKYTPADRYLFIDVSNPVHLTTGGTSELFWVNGGNADYQIKESLDALQSRYPDLRWRNKQAEIENIIVQVKQRMGMLWAFAVVVMACGLIGMFNTLSASIHAKRREYAVLRAIHLTPLQMIRVVITQSAIFSLLAVILGFTTGMIMAFAFYNALGGANQLGAFTVPRGELVIVAGFIVILTIFASMPMAYKLGKMHVTKALVAE